MDCSRFVDYADRPGCLIELHDFHPVTSDNLRYAKSVIPSGHFWQVERGDHIVAYIIDNRVEGIQGTLTVWHNKEVACLDQGEGQIWGDWLEAQKLLVSYEFQEVQDLHRVARIGRIAYNSHGVRGTYEGGKFYTLFRCDASLNHHEMREIRHGMS